jgi:hypothetical protein
VEEELMRNLLPDDEDQEGGDGDDPILKMSRRDIEHCIDSGKLPRTREELTVISKLGKCTVQDDYVGADEEAIEILNRVGYDVGEQESDEEESENGDDVVRGHGTVPESLDDGEHMLCDDSSDN